MADDRGVYRASVASIRIPCQIGEVVQVPRRYQRLVARGRIATIRRISALEVELLLVGQVRDRKPVSELGDEVDSGDETY